MSEVLKLTIKKILHEKRIMIPLFMLIVVGAMLAVTTYTWFYKGGSLLEIEFQTGYVEMNIGIYEGEDFDHDGVLDTDPEQPVYSPIFIPLEVNGGKANPITVSGIQGSVEELHLPDIEMTNLAPGQIYTYKFQIVSLGDIDSLFDLQLTEYNNANPADIKKYVKVNVLVDDVLISQQDLENWDESIGPLSLTGGSGIMTGEEATDVLVQFCFKETLNEVNSVYESGSFSLPNMRIRIYSAE